MLFNSFEFIYLFLPVTLIGFFVIANGFGRTPAIAWLVATSFFYYGSWKPIYLALIVASIAFNFVLGSRFLALPERNAVWRRRGLTFGIVANLALLAYFKYANFFVENVSRVTGIEFHWSPILLPIAISFFTFQQIAYLVDSYFGRAREPNFMTYALFITFFPHLIAGPIVHHREMIPQFEETAVLRIQPDHFAIGITIFFIGLFKKVILADNVAQYSTPLFDAARDGTALGFFEAWGGALAFMLQLYFDFSGYSDMAIGLSRMFGVRLPFNFGSPYKSTSIIEFWRRWHMTLSRFLRDYLFIVLGGNRGGPTRGQVNLFITMVLGGVWHGAAWTFFAWGALHGAYLVVNFVFRLLRTRLGLTRTTWAGRAVATTLTFVACTFALVFFRAETLESSLAMTRSMLGLDGLSLSRDWHSILGGLASFVPGLVFEGRGVLPAREWLPGLGLIAALLVVVFAFPNTQEYVGLTEEPYYGGRRRGRRSLRGGPLERFQWKPNAIHWLFVFVLAVIATGYLGNATEFLYYQF